MSNAHASSTTPHHVGQITKAQILVAHLLDTAPPDADTDRQAAVIVDQLQTELGWTPPRDLTAKPALRPDRVATDAERRAAMTQIRAVFASTTGERGDHQRDTLTTPDEAPSDANGDHP